jgi:ribonuclease E
MTAAHDDDADAGEVAAQHRSQPEFDFEDDAVAPVAATPQPAPSQPAEAAAAPSQAAAHDAGFAPVPSEHDVERTPPGPEINVESATGEDAAEAIAPGTWSAAPVANEPVAAFADTAAEPSVDTPASTAAAFVEQDVEPAQPTAPAEAVQADNADAVEAGETTGVSEPVTQHAAAADSAEQAPLPATPGLFDALPREQDPAQAAADAARDARKA